MRFVKDGINMTAVIWMTGFSGSGKTTIANRLRDKYCSCTVLDGDIMRTGLCSDLGFDVDSRKENIRRIAHVAKIMSDTGIMNVIVPVISPTNEIRNMARDIIGEKFFLVYVKCPLNICATRDVKGLYAKVKSGEIKEFTGISSPFDEPINADIVVDTSLEPVSASVDNILSALYFRGLA